MAAKLDAAQQTTFNSLANLEQQIAYCMGLLQQKQNAHNLANPASARNVVGVSPVYSSNTATFQASFPIEGDSVLEALHENITDAIPAA
ncbi:MAG: hypothetical protein F6K62_16800 [Sphaerospermopsis sp. SIO1G2]|nr:hypothetical protein [Sphaerospermopsis sp. SIO1G2]